MKKGNWELGCKLPNGSWVEWFLPRCLVAGATSPTAPLTTLILELVQVEDTKDSLRPHSQWTSSPARCLMISPDVCPACRIRQSQQRRDEKQAHLHSSQCHISLRLASDYSHVYYLKGALKKKKNWPQGKIKWLSLPALCGWCFNHGAHKDVVVAGGICQN